MLERMGHYRIEELIDSGSYATVYRAWDERLDRPVALKVLKPFWLEEADAVARFKREAQVMARLRHPNIVHIYDLVEAGGMMGLAQLLVEGESLADRIGRGPLSWA